MASVCREVVTLQLGHFSNYVGTHWWNLQDAALCYDPDSHSPPSELLSDVLFREGVTLGGQTTYTPRLITLDLKGSLSTLRQEGSLYETGKEVRTFTWEGEVMTHRESPPAKNSFLQDLDRLDEGQLLAEGDFSATQAQESEALSAGGIAMATVNTSLERAQKRYSLEGSVRVWSDFLRVHLHPRSMMVINQYNHDGESNRLEAFGQGEALCRSATVLEELEDRLHFFVEECDYLQGFQVLCDLQDGFSGLGSGVTELLHDAYGGRGIFTWGLAPVRHPDTSPVKELYHLVNSALGLVSLSNHSSLFCPLTLRGGLGRCPAPPTSFPHLQFDSSLWYHSSAVLAAALDTMTVPYRQTQGGGPMWQLSDALAVSGRKVAAAYSALPFPMMLGTSLPDTLSSYGDSLPWRPLSACGELGDGQSFGQSVTLRGIEAQSLVSALAPGTRPSTPLHTCSSGEEVLASFVWRHYPSTPVAVHWISSPCKLTPPFPQIFSPTLGVTGLLEPSPRAPQTAVGSVPVLSSLQSTPALHPCLTDLWRAASAQDPRRLASFLGAGTEQGDLQEALEDLRTLAQCYRGILEPSPLGSSEDESD
ncbi:MSTO1 protein, partial [Atractosteus spatula]|nr:MSTO1 protein [Atractosteus spatula]